MKFILTLIAIIGTFFGILIADYNRHGHGTWWSYVSFGIVALFVLAVVARALYNGAAKKKRPSNNTLAMLLLLLLASAGLVSCSTQRGPVDSVQMVRASDGFDEPAPEAVDTVRW